MNSEGGGREWWAVREGGERGRGQGVREGAGSEGWGKGVKDGGRE